MNNLLFSALAIALIYYFFFYLPHQKKISQPTFTNQATQTIKEVADKEVQTEKDEKESELKNKLENLREQLKTKDQTIQELKSDLTDYKKQTQGWRENKKNLEEQVSLFSENKELIRKAVKSHLNYFCYPIADSLDIEKKLAQINWFNQKWRETNDEEERKQIEEEVGKVEAKIQNLFKKGEREPKEQKEKQEKMLKQGKELLEKLKDSDNSSESESDDGDNTTEFTVDETITTDDE